MNGDTIHYITQGEIGTSRDPTAYFSAVLGSCIAACIWDLQAAVGGMNHFLLPFGRDDDLTDPLRFEVQSMTSLINDLTNLGADRRRLQAKLFGGATMMANHVNIGETNGRVAKDFLAAIDIPCVAESLGGPLARRVIFHPTSGGAMLRFFPERGSIDIV